MGYRNGAATVIFTFVYSCLILRGAVVDDEERDWFLFGLIVVVFSGIFIAAAVIAGHGR